MIKSTRVRLATSTLLVSAVMFATPAYSQEQPGQPTAPDAAKPVQPGPTELEQPVDPNQVQEPVLGTDAEAVDETAPAGDIVVTGSRIRRPNLESNTPIAVVSGEQLVSQGDVTLETFLNTLPQANPAATTTSNNPGNQGRAELDLRGLGSNRNIVLIDGRRPMVSSNTMVVDLNTIPAALIDRVDVISGGAGATYGADAVSGVVNVILKRDFSGLDVRGTYANTKDLDAKEFNVSAALGGNFADGRGNAVFGFDYTDREPLIKKQRAFAAFATSTTSFLPEGYYNGGNNAPSQAAVNALFGQASYGGAAPGAVSVGNGLGFNLDGTLFAVGAFNNPQDVVNFRYPIDFSVNQALFPDLYSYNFDEVNLLVLPLKRRSIMGKANFEISPAAEVFGQFGYTRYNSRTALAPTPAPTVSSRRPGDVDATSVDVITSLVEDIPGTGAPVSNFLIVPVTNPFISPDLLALLNSRTGNDAGLVGSGATEPFLIRTRTLGAGARFANFGNTVVQYLGGLRGEFMPNWRYEAYYSEGRTEIVNRGTGAIDTQRLQNLLEAPGGTIGTCTYNPFGRQPLSDACITYLEVQTRSQTDLKQRIGQAYVTGSLFELPGGPLSVVVGAELRRFRYKVDPGSLSGPISGPNTVVAAAGKNQFTDFFGEVLIPVLRDRPWAQELEFNLSARVSKFEVENLITGSKPDKHTDTSYGIQANYQPIRPVRMRATYQRAVRAPNFGELFAGGGSAPQYFDPCSANTAFRAGDLGLTPAQAIAFCQDANSAVAPLTADFTNYVQPPGSQLTITLAGNENVKPEKADTFTVGAVFNSLAGSGLLSTLRGSIDYYNIRIDDAIITPDPNSALAGCFNYLGTNPNFDPNNQNCLSLQRSGTGLVRVRNPITGGIPFTVNNEAEIKTSGIDMQLSWTLPLGFGAFGGGKSQLNFDAFVSHLIDFELKDALPGLPSIDYAGTIGYFGQGFTGGGGATFPKWRGTLNSALTLGDLTWNVRTRYIHSMRNRAAVQYVGEDASFTGVDPAWYFDTNLTWNIDKMMFRLGVNNVFDRKPELYAPNVQSGTDPSTYDVIGRRFFVTTGLRF
jgi:outer membrane receptor protein involved in Fe transport